MYYWLFKWLVFAPVVRVLYRPRVIGRDHVPTEGGAVLAANHVYAMDSVVLPAMLHRRMTYPAKAELFLPSKNPAKRLVAWFLRAIGVLPLNREGGRASAAGLGTVARALDGGILLGIYPEGTRTPDGRLYKGKTGVARLALHADVPVVPVGIVWGPARGVLPRRVELRIGEPLRWPDLVGHDDDHEVLRWVSDDVMSAIQRLTGQAYVDAYGASVKKGLLAPAELADRVLPDPHHGSSRPVVGAASDPAGSGEVDPR